MQYFKTAPHYSVTIFLQKNKNFSNHSKIVEVNIEKDLDMLVNTNYQVNTKQHFGMAVKKDLGFSEQLEKIYSGMSVKKSDSMRATIQAVTTQQADNTSFDLHLTEVGRFGGIKTKITSTENPQDAKKINLYCNLFGFLINIFSKSDALEFKSVALLSMTKDIEAAHIKKTDKIKAARKLAAESK